MSASPTTLDRRGLVASVLGAAPDALVVTGLGSASYDVYAVAPDRPGVFYLWGAMGAAVPTGLGLALAQPAKQIIVITGDGEMLMGIGSLGTVAVQQPANLTVLVLDNGQYGETGMQHSHTSQGADLTAIAAGFGFPTAIRINTQADVEDLGARIAEQRGPLFVQALITAGELPRAMPSRDGVGLKRDFRTHLGLPTL